MKRFLSELTRDMGTGLRMLARNPVLTAVLLLVMAVGIGVVSSVFSVVHGILLTALPYESPQELVLVRSVLRETGESFPLSYDDFRDLRERSRVFAGLGAWTSPIPLHLRGGDKVEIVRVEMPARKQVVLPASSYAYIRQVVWVLAGELVIVEGGERHVLASGDCLAFGPPGDVTIANESAEPCAYLVIIVRS